MKSVKILLIFGLFIALSCLFGCGGDTHKDDSDKNETMSEVEDSVYFTLERLIGVKPYEGDDEDHEGDNVYTYLNTKYLAHHVDIDLKGAEGNKTIYNVMEISQYNHDVIKNEANSFMVIYEDGTISKVITDKNLLEPGIKSANILDEDILCQHKLKKGNNWVSPNGTYSVVERYEYVVLDHFKRTAPSFKVSTYNNISKGKKIRSVWWCPDLGWFVQWQDWENETVDYLAEINFDWDDED